MTPVDLEPLAAAVVGTPLEACGFEPAKSGWTRQGDDSTVSVAVQRSKNSSEPGVSRFTLDWAVWLSGVASSTSPYGFRGAVLAGRIGALVEPPEDLWWEFDGVKLAWWLAPLLASSPVPHEAETALSWLVVHRLVPALDALRSIEDVVHFSVTAMNFMIEVAPEWTAYLRTAETGET